MPTIASKELGSLDQGWIAWFLAIFLWLNFCFHVSGNHIHSFKRKGDHYRYLPEFKLNEERQKASDESLKIESLSGMSFVHFAISARSPVPLHPPNSIFESLTLFYHFTFLYLTYFVGCFWKSQHWSSSNSSSSTRTCTKLFSLLLWNYEFHREVKWFLATLLVCVDLLLPIISCNMIWNMFQGL